MYRYAKRPLGVATLIASALFAFALVPANSALAQMGDKWVTVVLSEEPETLDGCYMNSSGVGRVVRQNIVETLVEIDPDDASLSPRLATSWEKINDTTWRFNLREGVTFHDGTPFNAETAAWGISRTIDTDLDCESRTKTFGTLRIKGVPVDEYTLDIVGNRPVPILATRMGIIGLVSPNTDMTRLVLDPVGTGPYEFDSYSPGESITLKRNENYWGDMPEAEGATYVWRSTSSVRAAMVEVGEADIAPNIAIHDATNPETDFSYRNSETTRLRIEIQRPPLNDKRVRRALNLAFDFDGIHGTVLSKDVIRATQVIGPNVAGYNPDLEFPPYDPDRARQLIAEAKADGVPVDDELWLIGRTGNYPGVEELLEAMQAMFANIGLNVTLRMMESGVYSEFSTKEIVDGKFAPPSTDRPPLLLAAQHDNNVGDAVFSMYNKADCDGQQSFLCDPHLDELIATATTQSGDERIKTWQEVQRYIYEELASDVYIAHMVGYARVNERIEFQPTVSTNTEVQLADITFN